MKQKQLTVEEAEAVAINAVGFLAGDPERIERFVALTGLGPAEIPNMLADQAFLSGVLDHLLADETLLFLFCEHTGIAPETPAAARMRLDRP